MGFKSVAARRLPAAGLALAATLALCLALPTCADDRSQARDQFTRAVRLRTMLEGYLAKDRSLSAYQQTVAAYHKVYLISVRADEVTPALVAEAELYEEMGRLYDPKYFQSAIDSCNFLVKQYPGSPYRGEALLSVARIQKDDLDAASDAEGTYQEYLKRFPHSQKAKQVREALKNLQNAELKDADSAAKPAPATNSANAKETVKDAAAKDVTATARLTSHPMKAVRTPTHAWPIGAWRQSRRCARGTRKTLRAWWSCSGTPSSLSRPTSLLPIAFILIFPKRGWTETQDIAR